jgi:hypothetical protein
MESNSSTHIINVCCLVILLLLLFGFCLSNKHCPSARCAYATNAVGKDLDIFAIGAVCLNHIYTHLHKILIIFVHTPNVLCYVVLS